MANPLTEQMMAAQGNSTAGPDDEEMLETVRRGMGNEGGPPPGSGMKWENLEEDQQALLNDPSPENVQAFVQYWGEESLPPELAQQAMGQQMGSGPPEGGDNGGGMY